MKQQPKANDTKSTPSLGSGAVDKDGNCLEPGKQPSSNGSKTGTASRSECCKLRYRKYAAKLHQNKRLMTITAVIIFVWILLACFIVSYHIMLKVRKIGGSSYIYNCSLQYGLRFHVTNHK